MNNKITFPKLAALLADKSGRSKRFSEDFIREFFALISETLEEGDTVKIKGFGSFRLSRVEPRMSVDVTTGQPIEISGHTKVVFAPSKELGETINSPFEAFSPLEIDENFDMSKLEGEATDEATPLSVTADPEEVSATDKVEEVATELVEVTPDNAPEATNILQQKETIRFEEETVEIDATLIEAASDEDKAGTSENIIDFTSDEEKVSDPNTEYDTAGTPYSETSEIDIQESITTEDTEETDTPLETEDDAEELEESVFTEETSQAAEIEEESESFEPNAGFADAVLEETETAEPVPDEEEITENSGNTEGTADDEPDSLNEKADFEDDDQSETLADTQQFGLIAQATDANDEEEGLDEVHEVEELQPESYDDEIEPDAQGSRRRQWLKGFMVGIAAAVGAILITFLVWYFYTSPSFKEKEQPREVPNLFSKNNEPVSSEVIAAPEAEPETDIESEATTDEEISVPDAGETDSEVAKAVATAASDAVVYDKISTTRYLITMAKEHYGNMNLWPYIYEENKHKLGDPDRIRPGTSVVIPPLSKYGIDPRNPKDIEKAKLLGKEIYARFGK